MLELRVRGFTLDPIENRHRPEARSGRTGSSSALWPRKGRARRLLLPGARASGVRLTSPPGAQPGHLSRQLSSPPELPLPALVPQLTTPLGVGPACPTPSHPQDQDAPPHFLPGCASAPGSSHWARSPESRQTTPTPRPRLRPHPRAWGGGGRRKGVFPGAGVQSTKRHCWGESAGKRQPCTWLARVSPQHQQSPKHCLE